MLSPKVDVVWTATVRTCCPNMYITDFPVVRTAPAIATAFRSHDRRTGVKQSHRKAVVRHVGRAPRTGDLPTRHAGKASTQPPPGLCGHRVTTCNWLQLRPAAARRLPSRRKRATRVSWRTADVRHTAAGQRGGSILCRRTAGARLAGPPGHPFIPAPRVMIAGIYGGHYPGAA